jgi:gluconolactonase
MAGRPEVVRAELADVEVVAEGLAFPEGPVALADGSVLVVEIAAGRLTRCWADGRTTTVAETGDGPNGAAIGPHGEVVVCTNGGLGRATRHGSIQRVDLDTGAVTTLYDHCESRPLVAPNDLVFDPSGAFWFTDYGSGTVHRAASDGSSITAAVTGLREPNGIGLSPDGTVLYWAETHTRRVQRRRIVAPGTLEASNGYDIRAVLRGDPDPWTLLAGLPGAHELDSLAIDSSGAVCVGTLVDAGITEISADGSSIVLHQLPQELSDGAVTNICFGGDDLCTAFITCSQHGRLVRARWHRPGLALAFNR